MGSLKRKMERQQRFQRKGKNVESTVFKLNYCLEDSGDVQRTEDGTESPVRIEVQNDPKFLLSILNSIDTSKEPFKNRKRTIMRLFASISSIARGWARKMKGFDVPDDEDQFTMEAEIPISPEGMEFLKELAEKPPEGVKYVSIPVQALIISIEDQYDEWKKAEDGKPSDASAGESSETPPTV